jgi:dihydroorotate dehydrogenase
MSGGRLEIKALGGVFTAADAFEAISAGASSVELLTGLVYEGWSVAKRINEGLLRLLDAAGVASVGDLRGTSIGLPGDAARPAIPAREIAG